MSLLIWLRDVQADAYMALAFPYLRDTSRCYIARNFYHDDMGVEYLSGIIQAILRVCGCTQT